MNWYVATMAGIIYGMFVNVMYVGTLLYMNNDIQDTLSFVPCFSFYSNTSNKML